MWRSCGGDRGSAYRPFSENGSDDSGNGLLLCRNHHSLFDMGKCCLDPTSLEVIPATGHDLKSLGVTRSNASHLRLAPSKEALDWRWGQSQRTNSAIRGSDSRIVRPDEELLPSDAGQRQHVSRCLSSTGVYRCWVQHHAGAEGLSSRNLARVQPEIHPDLPGGESQ